MDPSIVDSSIFGILWQDTFLSKEKWYAKPLVYTPNGGKQMVFIASEQNWIRTLDAVDGTVISQRQVQLPFLQSDIGCTDIPDYIGITGTPVIDPATDTVYFFSKGYKDGGAFGVPNGIYKFYAVDIKDLTDRPGFPILVDGHNADNDPTRYFVGGTVLQRPALALINGVVYGAFGAHCDKYNYTGMLVGISTNPSIGVVTIYAMEASPHAPAVVTDINTEQGGKAGIWMGGMAPATDGSRLFLTTGNGQGHENVDTPASGRSPLSTLDEVVANFAIGPGGKVTLQDYFEPYEYIGMDAGDRDLGSGGVALLDPTVFKGTNGVSRLAVTIGKNGKAYVMNVENLGGFKLGPAATDNIVQTIVAPGAVFGGPGSYPLEGGYLYFTPVGSPTLAYALGLDQNGGPLFSKVGQTPDSSAGRVGVGVPTVTTNKGQPGTGILWVTDVDGGLRAYHAVPDPSGTLVKINLPATGGLNKFQRPAFGDGRLYVTDNNAHVICLGSPVAVPLNCSSPVVFGDLSIGSTKTAIINCTALIAITKLNGITTSSPTYQASNASLPQGQLAKGATFSFPVTWNLTQESVQNSQNSSFGAVTPGVKSGSLVIFTTNGVPKYSTSYPISLQGTTVSSKPFLQVAPTEVDFGGIVVNGSGAASGLDATFIISNLGLQPLTISGYAYTTNLTSPVVYTNTTNSGNITLIGSEFKSSDLPAVGSIIPPSGSVTVPINFKTNVVGTYHNILSVWSDGGDQNVLMTGSASTSPIANISVETFEGGWDPSAIMDFGQVLAGTTVTRRIRLCNSGGSDMLITKSKPPIQTELRAENPSTDFHEGQFIAPNSCAFGAVDIAAAPAIPNQPPHTVSDTWTLNTDDINFGVHEVPISASIVTRQIGPLTNDGISQYQYLGCYFDGNGRQLQKQFNLGNSNENGICQQTCLSNGYRFAGTEYHVECWCGSTPPSSLKYYPPSANKCTFGCANDTTQACGGDGTFISIYYDASKYSPGCDSIPCSSSSTTAASSTSTSSSSTSISSNASTTSTTTTSSSASPTPTGPIVNPGNSDYSSIGCYGDGLTKSINPSTKYANDSMTVEICLQFCKSKGTTYAGIEYRRECYCGNALAADAVANSAGCTLTCFSNATEYCGGSKKMNVYQRIIATSSTTSVANLFSSQLNAFSNSPNISCQLTLLTTRTTLPPTNTSTVAPTTTSSTTASNTTTVVTTTSTANSTTASNTTTVVTTTSAVNSTTASNTTTVASATTSITTTSMASSTTASNTTTAASTTTGVTTTSAANSTTATNTTTVVSTTTDVTTTSMANSTTTTDTTTAASTTTSVTTTSTANSTTASNTTTVTPTTTGVTTTTDVANSTTAGSSTTVASTTSTTTTTSMTNSTTASSTTTSDPPTTSSSTNSTTAAPSSTGATTTTTAGTTTSSSASPASTSSVSTAKATAGFFYAGCIAEPATGKAMAKIAANDSMSIEFCISAAKAKLPATTYRYIGVEYGRECYGATAPVSSQTVLVGNKACTIPCMGNTTQSCGGRNMYNFYVSTAVTATFSGTTPPPTSTTGTVLTTP
ncbi:hypothetical protein GP486_005298 [Trichoglossum hirsutum]|uniref:WSC domain-containing protein n=1 Tax=Trichoglossum hirsutum TaxID=265104 RepID=A0A9P8RMI9_9PEZI|nr:hypothetical protein GP486_005298 [Trichoglossum hirsutum]